MKNNRVFLKLVLFSVLFVASVATAFSGEYEMREWKTRAGNATVKAKFLKCDNSIVHLELENGKQTQVNIDKLSADDWCYLDQLDTRYTDLHTQAPNGYSMCRCTTAKNLSDSVRCGSGYFVFGKIGLTTKSEGYDKKVCFTISLGKSTWQLPDDGLWKCPSLDQLATKQVFWSATRQSYWRISDDGYPYYRFSIKDLASPSYVNIPMSPTGSWPSSAKENEDFITIVFPKNKVPNFDDALKSLKNASSAYQKRMEPVLATRAERLKKLEEASAIKAKEFEEKRAKEEEERQAKARARLATLSLQNIKVNVDRLAAKTFYRSTRNNNVLIDSDNPKLLKAAGVDPYITVDGNKIFPFLEITYHAKSWLFINSVIFLDEKNNRVVFNISPGNGNTEINDGLILEDYHISTDISNFRKFSESSKITCRFAGKVWLDFELSQNQISSIKEMIMQYDALVKRGYKNGITTTP